MTWDVLITLLGRRISRDQMKSVGLWCLDLPVYYFRLGPLALLQPFLISF